MSSAAVEDSAFMSAMMRDDVAAMQTLLKTQELKQHIDYICGVATMAGKVQAVQFLVDSGLVDVNSVNNSYVYHESYVKQLCGVPYVTLINYAVINGDIDMVRMLLDRGADISFNNSIVLCHAVGKDAVFDELMRRGANVQSAMSNQQYNAALSDYLRSRDLA